MSPVEKLRWLVAGDVMRPEDTIDAILELDDRVRKLEAQLKATQRPRWVYAVIQGEYEERHLNSLWCDRGQAEQQKAWLDAQLPKEKRERQVDLAFVESWEVPDAPE